MRTMRGCCCDLTCANCAAKKNSIECRVFDAAGSPVETVICTLQVIRDYCVWTYNDAGSLLISRAQIRVMDTSSELRINRGFQLFMADPSGLGVIRDEEREKLEALCQGEVVTMNYYRWGTALPPSGVVEYTAEWEWIP